MIGKQLHYCDHVLLIFIYESVCIDSIILQEEMSTIILQLCFRYNKKKMFISHLMFVHAACSTILTFYQLYISKKSIKIMGTIDTDIKITFCCSEKRPECSLVRHNFEHEAGYAILQIGKWPTFITLTSIIYFLNYVFLLNRKKWSLFWNWWQWSLEHLQWEYVREYLIFKLMKQISKIRKRIRKRM